MVQLPARSSGMVAVIQSCSMNEHSGSESFDAQDAHFRLMCLIDEHPEYSQRRLAEAMGISLGKAHYLLRALFKHGLVKVENFRRSESKMSYAYRLTPSGVRHRLQLAGRFLARKEQEFDLLRSEIDQLRVALRHGEGQAEAAAGGNGRSPGPFAGVEEARS